MKSLQMAVCACALLAMAMGCNPDSPASAQDQTEVDQAYQEMRKEQDRAAEEAMKTSPFQEANTIKPSGSDAFKKLTAICLDQNGNLLACDSERGAVRVINPAGEVTASWKPGFAPEAIAAAPNGAVFVAGAGKLARLDRDGKVEKSATLSVSSIASMSASAKDVFLSARGETGFSIVRYSHDLDNPQTISTGRRGCCGTLDIAADGEKLLVAENSHKRIVTLDREGKELGKWGSDDRKEVSAFGGCCNPMNLCVSSDGDIYTAESSPDRIKHYKADGKYVEMVGWFTSTKSCRCVDLAISKDGRRAYVADSENGRIRVLERRADRPQASADSAKPREVATPGPAADGKQP